MEAPDKIYLYQDDRAGYEYEAEWGDKPWGENCVEYTRTDAFIEKACGWIKDNITNNPNANGVLVRNGCVTLGMLIEDFKKYMKE